MGVWPPTIFWSATDTTIGFLATEVSRVWPRLKGVGLSYPPPLFCSVRYSGIEYCPVTIMKIEVFSWFFLVGAEAMEEDAEGMLRPKPKEQPMPKLCEAWATSARLEETCECSGGVLGIKPKKHSTTQKHFSNSAYTWENTHKIFRIHTPYYLIPF